MSNPQSESLIETRARAEAEKRYDFIDEYEVDLFVDGTKFGYEQGKADRTYSTADLEAVAKAMAESNLMLDFWEDYLPDADAALSAVRQ